MKRRIGFAVVIIVLLSAPLVWGQDDGGTEGEGFGIEGMRPGVIFNASSLLVDVDAYQGGAGLKLGFEKFALRTLLAFGLQDAGGDDSSWDLTLGAAAEIPFFTGRVRPYWGGFVDGGISQETTEGEDATTETQIISGGFGPILGAEVFIFEFLSVFAEYQLAFDLARSTVETDGNEDETNSYSLSTELGNAGSLGIVIYLERRSMEADRREGR